MQIYKQELENKMESNDILMNILIFLDPVDLSSLNCTNKRFGNLIRSLAFKIYYLTTNKIEFKLNFLRPNSIKDLFCLCLNNSRIIISKNGIYTNKYLKSDYGNGITFFDYISRELISEVKQNENITINPSNSFRFQNYLFVQKDDKTIISEVLAATKPSGQHKSCLLKTGVYDGKIEKVMKFNKMTSYIQKTIKNSNHRVRAKDLNQKTFLALRSTIFLQDGNLYYVDCNSNLYHFQIIGVCKITSISFTTCKNIVIDAKSELEIVSIE